MSDPIGLVGRQASAAQHLQAASDLHAQVSRVEPERSSGAGAFKDVLMENLARVNKLQEDATKAVEDLHAGRRDDLETVLMATQKADTAFRMLLQVRNKVMSAYDELRQIRV